ncbi:hypothetical protein GCM10017786_57550 [Amycolatopsis deserti]|uniref:Transposase n=1 Tax=Amycolatopsis deserti TaxID=185696 RepID=A0ABQ3JCL2_9PSEU|nr:IS110 family transposase [Amycolatopsis deserti]GHF16169.1 hypothetical protein GCM10017786_57550 [Amycolatopsis deserti]
MLVTAGQNVVPVPPKLMARARSSARTRGKSDPIEDLAERTRTINRLHWQLQDLTALRAQVASYDAGSTS